MKFQEKLQKYDTFYYGLILGLILPIVGFILSYFIKTVGLHISFSEYFFYNLLKSDDKMDIIIFSMIPNMFLFYFVNFRWNMHEFTKGIVGVTLVMGIIVIVSSLSST